MDNKNKPRDYGHLPLYKGQTTLDNKLCMIFPFCDIYWVC